jgi:Fe-S cluster assembly iron-binding protein IscA
MIQVTGQAAALINELLYDAELPDQAGLRLAQGDDHPALGISLSREPEGDDVVLVADQATLFVSRSAAERLAGQTLDVRPASRAFYLRG